MSSLYNTNIPSSEDNKLLSSEGSMDEFDKDSHTAPSPVFIVVSRRYNVVRPRKINSLSQLPMRIAFKIRFSA